MDYRIMRFHFEEIIYILIILKSDLSKQDKEEFGCFAEAIEGRIEVLFEKDFLYSLDKEYGITDNMVLQLDRLKHLVPRLYGSRWVQKLLQVNEEINHIRQLASVVLADLRIDEDDPMKFLEEHLNHDW